MFLALISLAAMGGGRMHAQVPWVQMPKQHNDDGWSAPICSAEIGGRHIVYGPPLGWSISGGRFIPPKVSQADGYTYAVNIAAPVPWSDDRIKTLKAAVLRQLPPKGATEAAITSDGMLGVQSAGQPIYEVCMTYNYFGQPYAASADFIEKGHIQLQFCFGSLARNFPDLHGMFVHSLLSIQGF